jgi:glutamate/tyrosine decarboxylase-like PLP-dependent enzyme
VFDGFVDGVVISSALGHYSIQKAVVMAGLGKDSLWLCDVDACGRMDVGALGILMDRADREGKRVVMVNVTAGTSFLGAIDPVGDIVRVCQKRGVWCHVDGF